MGASESSLNSLPSVSDVTIPVQYSMMNEVYDTDEILPFHEPIHTHKLFKPPFHATWSLDLPISRKIPSARLGHFTIIDDNNQKVYIGFGTAYNSKLMSDLWQFDLENMTWKEIKIQNANPRNGCQGFLYKPEGSDQNEKIFLFGGFVNGIYSNEIQVIDPYSGDCSILNTSGEIPEPRSTPILAVNNNCLFVWGGYNGQWPTDISILDLKTLVWKTVHQNEKGRTSVPYIFNKDKGEVISYGGSHFKGLFVLDINSTQKPTTKIIQTTGVTPPSDIMNSAMVKVNNLVFYFGGKDKTSDYTILYALDIVKNWWFIFHVLPDNETVSLNDGNISENGIFMLPRMHSFSAAYSKKHRTIVAFLGSPCVDPPQLFLIKVGEPLGFINLRSDMSEMLQLQSM